jgi:hypothetical protein
LADDIAIDHVSSANPESAVLMDQQEKLQVFNAQTANVRRLESAGRQIRRSIHHAIRRSDAASEKAHSLVWALLYCAWLEALFSKLVHTPYGFTLDQIEQIKREHKAKGVQYGWHKCIELGLRRVSSPKSNYLPNIRQRLDSYVTEYVQEPAGLRNKIAHGQWEVALNRDHTAVNAQQTAGLLSLDVVTVDKWQAVAKSLVAIIEALIESPKRAFHQDYWLLVTKLDEDVCRMASWDRDSRKKELARKPQWSGDKG